MARLNGLAYFSVTFTPQHVQNGQEKSQMTGTERLSRTNLLCYMINRSTLSQCGLIGRSHSFVKGDAHGRRENGRATSARRGRS